MKIFAFAIALLPLSALAEGGLPTQPYIYVKGTAETEKAPDVVTLRFNLIGRAPDQAKANADVQGRATKVFAMLNERKIAKADVIAGELTSEAEFEEREGSSSGHGKLIGYAVTRSFSVKVRDVSSFPKLVDELISAVNAEFSGTHGEYSKEDEVTHELWQKAIANAREQAEQTAKQAEMKIDSVFAISPVPIPTITSTMFPRGDFGTAEEVAAYSMPSQRAAAAVPEYRLPPIHFEQSVHVIYLIAPQGRRY